MTGRAQTTDQEQAAGMRAELPGTAHARREEAGLGPWTLPSGQDLVCFALAAGMVSGPLADAARASVEVGSGVNRVPLTGGGKG